MKSIIGGSIFGFLIGGSFASLLPKIEVFAKSPESYQWFAYIVTVLAFIFVGGIIGKLRDFDNKKK